MDNKEVNVNEVKEESKPSISLGKGAIVAIVVLAVCLGLSAIFMKFDLNMWLMWLPMAACSVLGSTKTIKDVGTCWISVLFAAVLAFLLKSGVGGTPVVAVGFVILFLFVVGMVTKKCTLVCNNYTGIFLAAFTFDGLVYEPLKMAISILVGFLVFGMVPFAFGQLMAKKKAKAKDE